MVVLFNKFNKYLLNTYNVLRTMISNVDITETAEVLGEKDELGKHLSKMILVPETIISILKMRGPKEHQRREPNQSSEFLPIFSVHPHIVLSACTYTVPSFIPFLDKGFCLLDKP